MPQVTIPHDVPGKLHGGLLYTSGVVGDVSDNF